MENIDLFSITKKSRIFIYGAGKFGKENAQYLSASGYKIEGFIDQCADKIDSDKMVWPVETLQSFADNRFTKDCIVIVCVHNAMWHEEIACSCYEIGVERIVFLPTNGLYNQAAVLKLYKIYNACCTSHDYTELEHIPLYGKLFDIDFNYQKWIIREYSNHIVCIADSQIIFSDKYNSETDDCYEKNELIKLYSDVPLACMDPHINLFQFFLGAGTDPKLYLSLYKEPLNTFSELSDAEFLQERKMLFEMYQRQMNFGMEYFRNAPVKVTWNSKGYFNITDGHHRAAFLFSKGIRYIPIQMSKKDFFVWFREKEIRNFWNYLLRIGVDKVYTPISNLVFYHMEMRNWLFLMVDIFSQLLSRIPINKINCIEVGRYQACLVRVAYKMGFDNNYYYGMHFQNCGMINYLNELQHTKRVECICSETDMEAVDQVDMLILGSCVWTLVHKYESLLEKLLKRVVHYIFWISESDIEYEKEKIKEYFASVDYHMLWQDANDIEEREIGYFEIICNKEEKE